MLLRKAALAEGGRQTVSRPQPIITAGRAYVRLIEAAGALLSYRPA